MLKSGITQGSMSNATEPVNEHTGITPAAWAHVMLFIGFPH